MPGYSRLSVGFSLNRVRLTVNGYDPVNTSNRIQIHPGLDTALIPITANNQPCIADYIKFSAEIAAKFPASNETASIKVKQGAEDATEIILSKD